MTHPALPDGVGLDHARTLAERYAPRARFHRSEKHFPQDPEAFRRISRFRESNPWPTPDRGWFEPGGSAPGRFEEGDSWGPGYESAPWSSIDAESRRPYRAGAFDPSTARNRRPRDANNFRGGSHGIFLERREVGEDEFRAPDHPQVIEAPVFIDSHVHQGETGRYVRLLYWFWFELNWYRVLYTHEGDWEHVTWIWDEKAFVDGDAPGWAFFAQHNGGEGRVWSDLVFSDAAGLHPDIFVNPAGHPAHPTADDAGDYVHSLDTWRDVRQLRWVHGEPWRDFAGAWGAVGSSTHTTGPLGPAFKRSSDNVRIRWIGGRRHAVVPKWWNR